jgi:hypothetical protein
MPPKEKNSISTQTSRIPQKPTPLSKRNPLQKNHPPRDAEVRAAIANIMKNISQRVVPREPDLTEPISARNTPFGHNRLNISALNDASGDDPLVAKKNPLASHADRNEEPLVVKKKPFASHTN